MNERDVIDLILVAIVAVVLYIDTFGITGPLNALRRMISLLSRIDVRVYLVVFGLFGVLFLVYLTIYLPKQDANRPIQR
jgi:preprotein translocase subunit SecY